MQVRMVTLERDRLAAALHRKHSPKIPVDKLLAAMCSDLRLSGPTAQALTASYTVNAKTNTLVPAAPPATPPAAKASDTLGEPGGGGACPCLHPRPHPRRC